MITKLVELIKFDEKIKIVDIGANPLLDHKSTTGKIGEEPSYKTLLDTEYAELIGCEPNERAYRDLLKKNTKNAKYFNYAIGDGSTKKLNLCRGSGMTSTLKPLKKSMDVFKIYKKSAEIVKTINIVTKKLDEIEEIKNIDYLKIDIQGGELDVFINAKKKLSKTLFVQTEVSFINLYENEPTFGEIDIELRKHGLVPHCFNDGIVSKNIIGPMVLNNDPFQSLNQIVQTDMVYVKDFRDLFNLRVDEIKKICLIAHTCYKSWDLSFRCIKTLIDKEHISSNAIEEYLKLVPGVIRV